MNDHDIDLTTLTEEERAAAVRAVRETRRRAAARRADDALDAALSALCGGRGVAFIAIRWDADGRAMSGEVFGFDAAGEVCAPVPMTAPVLALYRERQKHRGR